MLEICVPYIINTELHEHECHNSTLLIMLGVPYIYC